MDFDFTTETITPDSTNILTIGGTGGLEVPVGTTAQRPSTGLVNGTIRYNTDLNITESYVSSAWASISGSVSSVAITGSTGLSVAGSPITSSGTITLTNTGVTSIAGTANQITASAATGAVTLSLPTNVTIGTSLTISGLTANSFLYSGVAGLLTTTAVPTNGQLLIGSTGAAPVAATITQGTGITITNGVGSIAIANAGVLSFSAGTTGFTPNTTTTGAITLAGTLSLANGGTNASLTAVNGGVVYSTASALAITTAGTNGQYLKSNGTVPVWVTDINGGLLLYAENPSTPTAPSATGTNATAFGSGAVASIFGTKAFANGSIGATGDAQEVLAVLRNTTSNATQTELFLDGTGAAQRLVLPTTSAWTFFIKIVARRTDATGSLGAWSYQGFIFKDATSATTTASGVSRTTIARIGSIGGPNDPVVDADTTNGSLRIRVTGVAAQTYRWVATCQLAQVTN